ncbi:DUF4933 domain-containing protein [Williamwhitmania taraxaci]|uniref:6-bladed beta-propeller protein n=1 Tax=Williamwhitmania taraxaci TaxID=1640674 RepID=A0A1G6Q0E5_9BACT|nr:DUF4933 domain-containing protein [Williamwhitmania taraxaci]SDC85115.1 hypothetical protein SAMN05216323_10568 [Williamwhitmania taraxaci]
MNKLLAFTIPLVLLAGCNSQGTIKTPENAEELLIADIKRSDSLAKSSIAFKLDEIPAGIRYPELRMVDKANPPVTLNIPASQGTVKPLALSALFKSVRYMVLDYGKDSALCDSYSQVIPVGDGYITTSIFSLCYFDSKGKLMKVIGKNEAGLIPVPNGIAFSTEEIIGVLPNASVKGDKVVYVTVDIPKKLSMVKIFDIKSMKTTLSAPRKISNFMNFMRLSPTLVTDSSWIEYSGSICPISKYTFCLYGMKGDTLTLFKNSIKGVATKRGNITDPDSWFRYEFNNQLTIRQPYCDTVFRFQYPNTLKPCFVLNFGKEMIDIESAIMCKTEGKYIPSFWFETSNAIVMGYSKNNDCPNNRKANKVKFYYAAYNKATQSLFHITMPAKYPEDSYISNDIDGGIPLNLGDVRVNNGKGIVLLSRAQLTEIATNETTRYLPKANRDAASTRASKLRSGQKLVVIYE